MTNVPKSPRPIFISADHGTAIIYFLQSAVLATILAAGVEVVVLTDGSIRDSIRARFARPGVVFESLRLDKAAAYARGAGARLQWLLSYLRRVSGSWRMNSAAMNSHVWEVWEENGWRFRIGIWVPAALAMLVLRSSRVARRVLLGLQMRFSPSLYADLFDKYHPSLVVASTCGWRMDRYLLREAAKRAVPSLAAIVGWDNSSSYALPGARIGSVTCWSAQQRRELVDGSDWRPSSVHVGGIPSYDGYLSREWVLPKWEYFEKHGLDPHRKLISYACSFVHFAPNLPNIRALAELVSQDRLSEPAQLLIRLHPSHFQDRPSIFAEERRQIHELEAHIPHLHVVHPAAIGGSLGYYGGEDMDEKSSMMAHSDVLVTVYSTMLVETAIHDTPMVAAVIDTPGGWNVRGKFSLPLREIGNWPTHERFRRSGAGRIASSVDELRLALNRYLHDRALDREARSAFVAQEITFTDGSAGRRTGEYILSQLGERSSIR